MKIKDGYLLREVAGQHVVLPVGEDLDMNVMITLNETGAFLWKQLEAETTKEQLVAAVLAEYDISEEAAGHHIDQFIAKLEAQDFLEDRH